MVQHDVIYADQPDIEEHGGADFQDVSIPILVDYPGLQGGTTNGAQVSILQVAPTIVALLGLDPTDLQAVRIEHTQVLPGLAGAYPSTVPEESLLISRLREKVPRSTSRPVCEQR